MTWVKQEWDYSDAPKQKQAMLDKMAGIDRFTVLMNEALDEVIFVGDASPRNDAQADVIAKALNGGSNDG